MSEATGTEASGSSFSSSAAGSSLASDNTDTRALHTLQEGPDGEAATDDLGSNNRSLQEGLFATLYTLTKNKALDTSLRVAALRVVLEFLQFFRVAFNFSFHWVIDRDLWLFKAIEWILFRALVVTEGYDMYISVFYAVAAVILATLLLTVWVAVVLKGSDSLNAWLKRLVGLLQLLALVMFCIAWPVIMDFMVFLFDCKWSNLSRGWPATHVYFTEQSCTAMPHLAHMLFAGVMILILAAAVLLMSIGTTDMNPMNSSLLSSSDAVVSVKMLILKIIFVVVSTMLDELGNIQAGFMAAAMFGVVYYLIDGVPYYNKVLNILWGGLWLGMLDVTVVLLVMQLTMQQQPDPLVYAATMTQVMLYTIFPAVVLGAVLMWLRLRHVARLSQHMWNAMNVCKAAVLTNLTAGDDQASVGSAVALIPTGELKKVHRFRDVLQVKMACRDMRKWDEDGLPDLEAVEFGEFVIKCGMARMPNSPALLVMYASFLIEARKDGQAARTQLQLAQKAAPSLLDNYNIYVAQQLAKQLKRDGDGLDLMGYVEFQRNYLACVRAHKQALMAQRAFWNSLLRDTISFTDLQAKVKLMDAAEQRATAVYRRVMERYPGNGRVMKVYGRFLEFVRNEPGAASRFYEAAIKQGTSESLLALTAAEGGAAGLSAAGQIDEKADGLVVINAQGTILMLNAAAVGMFGYQKGELDGKNVSVLMPQPYSTRHDSFLQRYVESGQPHILNKSRSMVALHKDRTMFPISLCVARLSGVGADTLFIGVMRHEKPATAGDGQVVKFWATAGGIILCADHSVTDAFGVPAGDLVGQQFSNLCTDVEVVNRFITMAAQGAGEAGDAVGLRTQVQWWQEREILHAFLPAVDVELSYQLGGAIEDGSDYRNIIIYARTVTEATAVMVIDHKGRILHASAKLANMLGHAATNLMKMELTSLLPQPICQMHGAWFKDPPQRIPSTSCRGGGVVHLLAANGTKVPVTLKMTTKEDASTGHLTHIVQVHKASEEQRLDQQRVVLNINHKGRILSVNAGMPRSLFGFDGLQLVGQPLSCVIDVFSDWKAGCGEELSLLELLVCQLMSESEGPAVKAVTDGLPGSSNSSSSHCASWRVGVHRPVLEAGSHAEAGATSTVGSSLLHALQPHKVQPVCMKLEAVAEELDRELDAETANVTPVLQVSLHSSDALNTVIELDKELRVGRADEAAGLMFGVHPKQLLHRPFARLVGLPDTKHFEDLLGADKHQAKKGAMKKSTAPASRAGSIRRVTCMHLGDGQPLVLNMQAMSYEQGGRRRMVVRLQLAQAVSAAMDKLLALKEGREAAAPGTVVVGGAHEGIGHKARGASSPSSPSSSSQGSHHESSTARLAAEASAGDAAAAQPAKPSDRVRDWVRQASTLDAPDDDGSLDEAPRHQRAQHHVPHSHAMYGADGLVSVNPHTAGRGAKGQLQSPLKGKQLDEPDDGDEEAGEAFYDKGSKHALVGKQLDKESSNGRSSMAGSNVDGMSESGCSGADPSASAGGMAHDEELAVDMRRVKRLKKLSRMMASGLAQAATNLWKNHTIILLAVVLVTRIACFAVMTIELDARHANAVSVNTIALSMAAASQSVLRANFLQKCAQPAFQGYWVCQKSFVEDYGRRLASNTAKFHQYHQDLYLGGGGLQPFRDPRLVRYWTYAQVPETQYYPHMSDGQPAFVNGTRTLWEMGNLLVQDLSDIYFHKDTWGATMNAQPAWQYVFQNGPASLFNGYAWSLDIFVDYTWKDLTKLSATIIIVLVIEAVIVQMSCMAYEFVLLQRCNVSHMRLYSVFLALPSATIRYMVRRPLVVDDSTSDDLDEDDLDLVEGAAAAAPGAPGAAAAEDGNTAAGEAGQTAAADKKKSVRLLADDTEDGKSGTRGKEQRAGVSSSKLKSRAAAAQQSKTSLGRIAAFRKHMHKALFGWMDPKFKRNGKKLSPSSSIVWRFMAPLLLWVAAVVVIYGVSYSNVQGLQAPLASLDLSAHVMYRLTRARLYANLLGFSVDDSDNAKYRYALKEELTLLKNEYDTLLYGGRMVLQANVTFNTEAPAAVFQDAALADIFFKTTECLRLDKSTCYQPGDEMYEITHSGLDAQIIRYIEEMTAFSNLPDQLAMANHSTYEFVNKVTARDTYEGLQQASSLFAAFTLSKLDSVKELHIILLVISLCCMALFVLLMYRPYIKALRRDTKAVVNMLSQLPAEVDVEGQVKAIVLGITKTEGQGSKSMELLALPPGGPNTHLQPYGMGPPGMLAAGGGMGRGGWAMAAGAQGSDGWFGRRHSNNGPQGHLNDFGMNGYSNLQGGQYGGMV